MKLLYPLGKRYGLLKNLKFLLGENKERINVLRSCGMKIGQDCLILTTHFSTEPYLISIGDHVGIAAGTRFITHDGSIWVFRKEHPDFDVFGKINIGNNTMIGVNCIILPNTIIGENCIVGAGSVVRGKFPDNSVIIGNPAKTVMKIQVMEKLMKLNKNVLNIKFMSPAEKEEYIKKHFNI